MRQIVYILFSINYLYSLFLIKALTLEDSDLAMEFNPIHNAVDFDAIKTTTPYGLVFSFKTYSDIYKDYHQTAENFVSRLHSRFIRFNYLDLPIYSLNCALENVEELCVKDNNFFVIILFEGNKTFRIEMSPDVAKPSESQYTKMLFLFYRQSWPNFHDIVSGMDLRSLMMDKREPRRKWVLCYGETFHPLGRNFCYTLGSFYRKNPEISIAVTDNKESLSEVNDFLRLNIDVNGLVPMLGLWYLNCSFNANDERKVPEFCRCYQYWGDDVIDNIHLFFKLLFVENFVRYPGIFHRFKRLVTRGNTAKMKQRGSIKPFGTIPGPVLFCFHTNSTRKSVRADAKLLAERLRGFSFVVTVNVDFVDRDFLTKKMSLNSESVVNGDLVYKLWPRSPTFPDTKIHQLLEVTDKPVGFVMDFYKKAYDLESIYQTVLSRSGEHPVREDESRPSDPTVQDDEIEVLLHAFKKIDCPTCYAELKNVTELNETSVLEWQKSKSLRMIMYWLNVDTLSKAALHVLARASTTVPFEYPVFGAVGCHHWPRVCQHARVETFTPQLLIYKNEKLLGSYKGVLDADAIANTAILFSRPSSVELKGEEETFDFLAGKFLRLANNRYLSTYTLGIFESSDDLDLQTFLAAAKRVHGKYALAWTLKSNVEQLLVNKKIFSDKEKLPKFVTFKNNDPVQFVVPNDQQLTGVDGLVHFVQRSSRPQLVSVTQLSYPAVRRMSKPLLLAVSSSSDSNVATYFHKLLIDSSVCLIDRIQCASLNATEEPGLFTRLRELWNLPENQENHLVYADNADGVLYVYDKRSDSSLTDWLHMIESRNIDYYMQLQEYQTPERPLMFNYSKLRGESNAESQESKRLDAGTLNPKAEPPEGPAINDKPKTRNYKTEL